MGYYINPPNMSKEEFLFWHGRPLTVEQVKEFDYEVDEWPVVHVHNGSFTAAAIAHNANERDSFLHDYDPRDPDKRPKRWYAVKKSELLPYMRGRKTK